MNLRLAQQHYRARVLELRDLIAAEEEKFKSVSSTARQLFVSFGTCFRRLAAEIDDIRSGVWDDKIAAKITGATQPVETSAAELSSVREKTLDVSYSKRVNAVIGSLLQPGRYPRSSGRNIWFRLEWCNRFRLPTTPSNSMFCDLSFHT